MEKIKSDGTRVGVNNTGTLQARSGQVLISASVATQVVNAAVNMSGVVDASAFAPNGKGGSVLITSEGDINLSGQVNAAGAGSGAGGQIITKAVGADNIAANAVMTAAGGAAAADQGGQIEVSGHDVLLSGNINPGSGGTLLIDPFNVIVTATKGFNDVAGATVSEAFISKQLRRNVSVDIQASHDIVFVAAGNSHMLVGGNGNLTLDAANDIIFSAGNYVIETKVGAVTLTAGGDIGAPGHRLSVISGEGNHGPGVNVAGDILLTAGNDIYVDTITAKASGKGLVTALFSADAGGTFSAAGLIDVGVLAKGPGGQTANAEVDITAGNTLTLHGLKDVASAQEVGIAGNAIAHANLGLLAGSVIDDGNMTVFATVRGKSGHSFSADAELAASANLVQIDGQLDVIAKTDVSSGELVIARAVTQLEGTTLSVASGPEDEALACDHGVGAVLASALVNIKGDLNLFANAISLGSLSDKASAKSWSGGPARALTDVTLAGPVPIHIAGDVAVSANAHNFGGAALASGGMGASANADLALSARVVGLGGQGGLTAGDVSVVAHATNSGSGAVGAQSRIRPGRERRRQFAKRSGRCGGPEQERRRGRRCGRGCFVPHRGLSRRPIEPERDQFAGAGQRPGYRRRPSYGGRPRARYPAHRQHRRYFRRSGDYHQRDRRHWTPRTLERVGAR